MNLSDVKPGLRVRTRQLTLDGTVGLLIHARHLAMRKSHARGTVGSYVPGHGGDVWWVQHEDDPVPAAYCFDEFEPACDGDHGAPRCADPECWQVEPRQPVFAPELM